MTIFPFNWFNTGCKHKWSPWYIVYQKLKGPYGITEHAINERMCIICELRERKELINDK